MTRNEAGKQAEAAKKKGNEYFKEEKLGAAIYAYTEAVTLCPEVKINRDPLTFVGPSVARNALATSRGSTLDQTL
ncbi:hypothetical protein R1sor_009862 [Riccia sorocarpa]|uniref:Uncharacterized protein n=1 Tax=Riccia sorocarpa TaxID=122646 RepID=A0ABD3I0E3_9MARC